MSSEQLELLLGLDLCGGLAKLSTYMAKDPSVVSRNLQRLAEAAPVIVKVNNRWQISPLGRQIIGKASTFRNELTTILNIHQARHSPGGLVPLESPALIIINAQKGLLDGALGGRSNHQAERNISRLIEDFRNSGRPIFHIRHISESSASIFYQEGTGAEFLPELAPRNHEVVIDKKRANAFSETSLLEQLNEHGIATVIVSGFTANECIDATARQAGDFGFTTIVVGDATASFDIYGPDGSLHLAERIHRLTLANLHAFFATVMDTAQLLTLLSQLKSK